MAVTGDWWLEDGEKAILDFHAEHPLGGYQRRAFMMLDADVVVVSPASVDRVSRAAGLRERHHVNPSLKGKNFQQPLRPHEHWHVDVSYLNVARTFFSLCGLLDDCNRFLVHGEVRETMTEAGVETILQRARERYPDTRPRIIFGQWPAVDRQGLQGVRPDLRDDSCGAIALPSLRQRRSSAGTAR